MTDYLSVWITQLLHCYTLLYSQSIFTFVYMVHVHLVHVHVHLHVPNVHVHLVHVHVHGTCTFVYATSHITYPLIMTILMCKKAILIHEI